MFLLFPLLVAESVFTDTLLRPGSPEEEVPYSVEAQGAGGLGRFMACSNHRSADANVQVEPCVVDSRFCMIMFTMKRIEPGTPLRWYYGPDHKITPQQEGVAFGGAEVEKGGSGGL